MNNYSQQSEQTMKQSFFIQWCIGILLLCAAPMAVHAQTPTDTLITIYGKKFAPGIKVFVDGNQVDSTKVQHDATQPSRILYIRIPLSWLVALPVTLQSAKPKGGSTAAVINKHIVTLQNPSPSRGPSKPDTLVVQQNTPSIKLKTPSGQVIQTLSLSVAAGTTKDTTIQLDYSGIALQNGTATLQLQTASPFSVLDSLSNPLNSVVVSSQQGTMKIILRFQARAQLGIQITALTTKLADNTTFTLPMQGFSVKFFKVLAAYTPQSATPFNVFVSESKNDIDATNAVTFFPQALQTLNNYIEQRYLQDTTTRTEPIYFTRFVLVDNISIPAAYQEGSPTPELHTDIDAEPTIAAIQTRMNADPTIQCAILLVNTDAIPYRAVGSTCGVNTVPQYIVAEAKYVREFINERNAVVDFSFFQLLLQAIK